MSLCAYGWAFYCLYSNSITKVEAGLTVGFYFIMLIFAYIIDRLVYCVRQWRKTKVVDEEADTFDPTYGLT